MLFYFFNMNDFRISKAQVSAFLMSFSYSEDERFLYFGNSRSFTRGSLVFTLFVATSIFTFLFSCIV